MAKKKKVPKWVATGNPSDANPQKEHPESQQEEPQVEAEVLPPPPSEAQKQKIERQHIPWTPEGVSEEEHQKQIEEVRAKPIALGGRQSCARSRDSHSDSCCFSFSAECPRRERDAAP
jgi:hypothetical protein